MLMLRDHFVHMPSQWETMLQCNVVSHWLDAYTKWSLDAGFDLPFLSPFNWWRPKQNGCHFADNNWTFSNVLHWMKVMHFVIASAHQQALGWITTTLANIIVLFHNDFPPSGEQPEHCILVHEFWQPTAGCMAIFHKYCCYTKHGGVSTNLTHWGYVTDVSKYNNAGIWSMNQNILHFMFKII